MGLPLFITTNLPFLNVTKYWQLFVGVFPKFLRLMSNGCARQVGGLVGAEVVDAVDEALAASGSCPPAAGR